MAQLGHARHSNTAPKKLTLSSASHLSQSRQIFSFLFSSISSMLIPTTSSTWVVVVVKRTRSHLITKWMKTNRKLITHQGRHPVHLYLSLWSTLLCEKHDSLHAAILILLYHALNTGAQFFSTGPTLEAKMLDLQMMTKRRFRFTLKWNKYRN